MSKLYSPYDWHWIVGGDESRFWSSAVGAYVSELPEGAGFTRILNEAELAEVLAPYKLRGPLVGKQDLYAERDRRLALGFDFTFPDERGTHRINTTPADMLGWDEVTKLAQALINLEQPNQTITIATGTGLAQVTAMEWQGVLLAAGSFRQLIWASSFAFEAMDPIPADFADDSYWTAA